MYRVLPGSIFFFYIFCGFPSVSAAFLRAFFDGDASLVNGSSKGSSSVPGVLFRLCVNLFVVSMSFYSNDEERKRKSKFSSLHLSATLQIEKPPSFKSI